MSEQLMLPMPVGLLDLHLHRTDSVWPHALTIYALLNVSHMKVEMSCNVPISDSWLSSQHQDQGKEEIIELG